MSQSDLLLFTKINIIDMARICGNLNFLNKNNNKSTNAQINKWIKEMIALYGTQIDYFVYDYKLERHDQLLGEDRPAPFLPPVGMRAIVNINNDNLMLSKFGLQTQSDLVMYVDYQSFANALGNNLARPKAGDLIRLTELGMDRPLGPYGFPYYGADCETETPTGSASGGDSGGNDHWVPIVGELTSGASGDVVWPTPEECTETDECCQTIDIDSLICCKDPNKNDGDDTYGENMDKLSAWNLSGKAPFGPNIYEITTVKDEDIAGNLNPMLGHYVWKIEAIRFDNSYQPNAPVENGSNMVNDAPYYGKLPGGTQTPENGKLYPQTTDKEEDRYWDHNKYKLDQVYGGYGYKPKEEVPNRITYDPKTDPYSPEYWVVFDSLPFYDLATIEVGFIKYYNLFVKSGNLSLEESEEVLAGAKAKYYIRDTSKCVDPNRLYVYAIFVFDGGIAVQYVGDVTTLDDVIYSSIFIKDQGGGEGGADAVARLWINQGKLTLTSPVTEDNKKGENKEEEGKEVENQKLPQYTDTKTKFGEETSNPINQITQQNKFKLGDLDDPFANL